MRILVVEDDFTSRKLLQRFLTPYGDVDVAINGKEALNAFEIAINENNPYELMCLDIMMPVMDGHTVLKKVRRVEEEKGIVGLAGLKIIMTTAVDEKEVIMASFRSQCDSYIVKPITREKLLREMTALGFKV